MIGNNWEIDSKLKMSFKLASPNMKCLGMNLTKHIYNLGTNDYKTWL